MTDIAGKDAALNAAGYIAGDFIDNMFGVLYEARRMKDHFTLEQKRVVEACSTTESDRMKMVFAMSQLSDKALAEWEERLLVLRRLADGANEDLFDYQQIKIVTMFLVVLGCMKPRSRRHLENFLNALTDGDWMDGFIMGKGGDIEFRCVDRADEEVRKSFGL